MPRIKKSILLVLLAFIVLGGGLMLVPAVHERVAWRVNDLGTRVYFILHPPEKAVFVPQEAVARIVQLTVQAMTPGAAVEPTGTPTPGAAVDTPVPTLAMTPLPASMILNGIHYFNQHFGFNECAPSNLAMALSFWGWTGKPQDVAPLVKPFEQDKNVMPYELADYVVQQTNLAALVRYGGTPELVKSLVAAGYPVLIEKGVYFPEAATGKVSWMGHYNVINGYDDSAATFIVQDSFLSDGANYAIPVDTLVESWRSFDYVFLVVYPKEKQGDLFAVLGDYADEKKSDQIGLDIASNEISTFTGVDQFFAYYNRGTSLVHLQDYKGAADAYDEAFKIYANLAEVDKRPYRMTWYQTGPYYAYFYNGRYQDVIDLTTITLESTNQPYLEENYYWRARAEAALGQMDQATKDLKTSLKYHVDFSPSLDLMLQLGISN
jgi:hypothetical protein